MDFQSIGRAKNISRKKTTSSSSNSCFYVQKGPILILKYKCDYIQDCTFKICSKGGDYNDEYIANLKFILHLFESASCLNLNLNKSTIFPGGFEQGWLYCRKLRNQKTIFADYLSWGSPGRQTIFELLGQHHREDPKEPGQLEILSHI